MSPELDPAMIAHFKDAWQRRLENERNNLEERKIALREAARTCARCLKNQFGVTRVLLVGSLATDGSISARTDIDLAIEGLAPARYFPALARLYDLLRAKIPGGVQLDLITLESAPYSMRRRAEQTGVDLLSE